MARRLRRTSLILLLVLCTASLAWWVRSHYRRDAIDLRRPAQGTAIRSDYGSIRVYLRLTDRGRGVEANAWHISDASNPFTVDEENPFEDPTGWNWATLVFTPGAWSPSFGWQRLQASPPSGGTLTFNTNGGGGMIAMSPPAGARPTVGDDYLRITFPHWLLVCAFGFFPALAALRFAATHWRRYRRLLVGACPVCAYDLRATPGRCPECGWTFDDPRAAGKNLPQAPVAERQTLRT